MISQILRQIKIITKSVFADRGVVGPHLNKRLWNQQFVNGHWARLADENQQEHYLQILELFKKHCNSGSVLDIGCGEGLLYPYFMSDNQFSNEGYLGVDISDVAIEKAKKNFPTGDFKVLDFQKESISKRFDTVIFNESLYYFNNAEKTLTNCLSNNVVDGGNIIISMCDYSRHDHIWKAIEKKYNVIDTLHCINEEGISWTVKII